MRPDCVEQLPHSCGSSDALQVFHSDKDGYNGYCFACDTYVEHPYGVGGEATLPTKPKIGRTQENIDKEIVEIETLPSVDLDDRKLRASTLDYFGVRVGLSEQDGSTPVFHYYPYYTKKGEPCGYKIRLLPKKMWSIGDIKQATLFGWAQAVGTSARTLFITEGELDALSLFQALTDKQRGTKWEDHNPAVVSLINGSSSVRKTLTEMQHDITSRFKDIVLVFDQDEAGEKATKEAMLVFPAARSVSLPAVDPSECIQQGRTKALADAVLFRAAKPRNTRLVWARDIIAAGREPAKRGVSWPWPGLTALTRGIRMGETIYLGSGVKMGKTTSVAAIAAHFIKEHEMKVFLAQPEEPLRKTNSMVMGKMVDRIFTDPNIEFDFDKYDEAGEMVKDYLCIMDLYQDMEWHQLRADIIDAVAEDCRAVFIDPITNITNGIASSEANVVLQEVAQGLATLARDLDIVIFIFCHLKAPDGRPHEHGGKVFSSQFAGSRAMMRSCNLMLGMEGDKSTTRVEGKGLHQKERVATEAETSYRKLIILEDREFGVTGFINLTYDEQSGALTEIEEV